MEKQDLLRDLETLQKMFMIDSGGIKSKALEIAVYVTKNYVNSIMIKEALEETK